MLTAEQLRAARALKRWDQSDIAARSGVSVETIKRLEKMDGRLTTTRVATIDALRQAYEAAGVIFVAENGEGPGVRLRKATAPQTATEADMQASAAVVRAQAADAVDDALSGSGATKEQKAERRRELTDEPAVIGRARGKGAGSGRG